MLTARSGLFGLPLVILPLVVIMLSKLTQPTWLPILLHLAMLFVAAMVCHGELAKDRPPTRYLTAFYLWMSAGGVLGGMFNALVAPLIFDTIMEYPLAMVLACLLRPGSGSDRTPPHRHWLDYAMPLALGALVAAFALAIRVSDIESRWLRVGLLCGPPTLICYLFRYWPIRFGLGIGAFLFVGLFATTRWASVLHLERSFFGVYRVTQTYQHGAVFPVHGLSGCG
jgi:hypothetical protein